MTAQNDLDRTLGAWFGAEAAPAPAAGAARAHPRAATATRRPRPSYVAGFGSHWVRSWSSDVLGDRQPSTRACHRARWAARRRARRGRSPSRRPALRSADPAAHAYLNELVSSPDLSQPMLRPVLVPLVDGRVFVVDGANQSPEALLYDPATGASVTAGPMVSADSLYVTSAVRLLDGRVLVLGDTAVQVFDPMTMRFAPVGPAVTPALAGDAALLADGRVLITRGTPGVDGAPVTSAELFDPATLTFSATGAVASSIRQDGELA